MSFKGVPFWRLRLFYSAPFRQEQVLPLGPGMLELTFTQPVQGDLREEMRHRSKNPRRVAAADARAPRRWTEHDVRQRWQFGLRHRTQQSLLKCNSVWAMGHASRSGCKPWVEALSCGLRNCKGKDLASGSVVLRGKGLSWLDTMGDYCEDQSGEIVSRPGLVGDVQRSL